SSASHGFSNGDEVYLTGIKGMVELNNQFFKVANVATNTFELQNIYGSNVDSSQFNTYSSDGSAATPYEIDSPYLLEHIPEFHFRQSADTIYITHQKYAPYKLTRTGH